MPTLPALPLPPRMERVAGSEDVAKVLAEEVVRYKFPPAFLKDQWLFDREDGSERVS